jgi:hypothetical protein
MGKQCRERWFNHLAPSVKKGEWTVEEDMRIMAAVQQHGTKWSVIVKELPGRSDNAIKNRYYSAVRKAHRQEKRTDGPAIENSPTADPKDRDTEAARLGIELRHMAGPGAGTNTLGGDSPKASKRRKRNSQEGVGTPEADDDGRTSMPRYDAVGEEGMLAASPLEQLCGAPLPQLARQPLRLLLLTAWPPRDAGCSDAAAHASVGAGFADHAHAMAYPQQGVVGAMGMAYPGAIAFAPHGVVYPQAMAAMVYPQGAVAQPAGGYLQPLAAPTHAAPLPSVEPGAPPAAAASAAAGFEAFEVIATATLADPSDDPAEFTTAEAHVDSPLAPASIAPID